VQRAADHQPRIRPCIKHYPGETNKYPDDSIKYPGDSIKYPGDSIKYPGETVRYPGERVEMSSLLGEQEAVTDMEPPPPLGDDDLYLDSLEEYEIPSRVDDETAPQQALTQTDTQQHQDATTTEINVSSQEPELAQYIEDLDHRVAGTDPTPPSTECVPTDELPEPLAAVMETLQEEAGPGEETTGLVDAEGQVDQELTAETLQPVHELSPDSAADRDATGQSQDDEV